MFDFSSMGYKNACNTICSFCLGLFKKIFFIVIASILLFPLLSFSQECPCSSQVIGKGFGLAGGYSLSSHSSAISSNGDFFVLWRVPHPTLPDISYRGRLFGPFGNPKSTTLEFQSGPIVPVSVTYNPVENEFLVLLQKQSTAANQTTTIEYFTQRISADGNLVNQPVKVTENNWVSELPVVSDSVLLFDSLKKNFLLGYLVKTGNIGRIYFQRLTRKGHPLGSRILVKKDNILNFDLKHDVLKNRFMLVWSTKGDIVFQILGPDLKKINTSGKIPTGRDVPLFTSLFSAKAGFFVIFWNDSNFEIIANTVDFNGVIGGAIKIGVKRVVRTARPNPAADGFVILVDSTGILRLNSDFSVKRNVFEVACADDYTEAFGQALMYNLARKEFIVLWILSSPNLSDTFLQGRRIRAAPASNTCS